MPFQGWARLDDIAGRVNTNAGTGATMKTLFSTAFC
jgi:hypothetical protein